MAEDETKNVRLNADSGAYCWLARSCTLDIGLERDCLAALMAVAVGQGLSDQTPDHRFSHKTKLCYFL